MKKFLIIFSLTVLIAILIAAFLPLAEAKGIYDGVIRLHVIANSDSDEDQELKLAVRDAILARIDEVIGECENADDAYNTLDDNIDLFNQIAADTIDSLGYDYSVNTTLAFEYYPTKEYEEVTLPAGEYRSMRVIIGEGEGHNWWCVLYPPLCTGSASATEELAETGFTPNQIRIITDKDNAGYTVKFKVVEYFSELKYRFKKLFS